LGNPVAFSCTSLVFSVAVSRTRSAAQLPVAVAASMRICRPAL
jgi:hypothetical protein